MAWYFLGSFLEFPTVIPILFKRWCIYIAPFSCNMLKGALQWSVYPQRTGSIYRCKWQPFQISPCILWLVLILPTPEGWKAEWTLAGKKITSLLAGSPVELKSKRFVFEIFLARENRGEGPLPRFLHAKRTSKTNLFDFNPTGEPASRVEGRPNIQPSTRPGVELGISGLGGIDLNHCANPSPPGMIYTVLRLLFELRRKDQLVGG